MLVLVFSVQAVTHTGRLGYTDICLLRAAARGPGMPRMLAG